MNGTSDTNTHLNTEAQHPDAQNPKTNPVGNAVKDPQDWVTKDEPMTGAQASYLKTLCEEGEQEFNPELTKAEASELIDSLQTKTGRGKA